MNTQFNDVITHVCVLSVRPSTHPSLSVTLACYTFNKPIHNYERARDAARLPSVPEPLPWFNSQHYIKPGQEHQRHPDSSTEEDEAARSEVQSSLQLHSLGYMRLS